MSLLAKRVLFLPMVFSTQAGARQERGVGMLSRILPRDRKGAGSGLAGSEGKGAAARAGECTASRAQSSARQQLTGRVPSCVLLY